MEHTSPEFIEFQAGTNRKCILNKETIRSINLYTINPDLPLGPQYCDNMIIVELTNSNEEARILYENAEEAEKVYTQLKLLLNLPLIVPSGD